MSDTYCKQLYRDITSNYYQEFTSFMTKHWYPEISGDSEITQEERQGAYQNFYKTIKDARIANRQTDPQMVWAERTEHSIQNLYFQDCAGSRAVGGGDRRVSAAWHFTAGDSG